MQPDRPFVLSIAGFDPSGGAGVLSDIKTFEFNQTSGLGVCSALTFQNENEFDGLEWVSFEIIQKQLNVLFRKYPIDVVKIGLVQDFMLLNKCLDYLRGQNSEIKIIWDPIVKASAGFSFHNTIDPSLLREISSKVYLITPNLPEILLLTNHRVTIMEAVMELHMYTRLYLKGGHSEGHDVSDLLFVDMECIKFEGTRIVNGDKHGSGCVLSSAIAANLAKGLPLKESCRTAHLYTNTFLQSNLTLLGYHTNV